MKHEFKVIDMTCAHCENAIINAIRAVDSGAVVTVDRANDSVMVTTIEPRDSIATVIADEGYTIAP